MCVRVWFEQAPQALMAGEEVWCWRNQPRTRELIFPVNIESAKIVTVNFCYERKFFFFFCEQSEVWCIFRGEVNTSKEVFGCTKQWNIVEGSPPSCVDRECAPVHAAAGATATMTEFKVGVLWLTCLVLLFNQGGCYFVLFFRGRKFVAWPRFWLSLLKDDLYLVQWKLL